MADPSSFLIFCLFWTKFLEHVYILDLNSNSLEMHKSLFSKDISMQQDVWLWDVLCFVYRNFADLSAPRISPSNLESYCFVGWGSQVLFIFSHFEPGTSPVCPSVRASVCLSVCLSGIITSTIFGRFWWNLDHKTISKI